MPELTFPSRPYFEVEHDAFDTLIQRHLDIPGFEAQRVYEWPNDTYKVACSLIEKEGEGASEQVAPGDDANLLHLLRFLANTRQGAIAAAKQEWRDLMAGRQGSVDHEPEPYTVLDRQLADYQRLGYFLPPLDAFLRELTRRDSIPEGWYLISICW